MIEKIRIDGEIYVAQTIAATTARVSAHYFRQLCRRGYGPPASPIKFERKRFYRLSEVKVWARERPWLKTDKKKTGPVGNGYNQVIRVLVTPDALRRWRQKFPYREISPFLRDKFMQELE